MLRETRHNERCEKRERIEKAGVTRDSLWTLRKSNKLTKNLLWHSLVAIFSRQTSIAVTVTAFVSGNIKKLFHHLRNDVENERKNRKFLYSLFACLIFRTIAWNWEENSISIFADCTYIFLIPTFFSLFHLNCDEFSDRLSLLLVLWSRDWEEEWKNMKTFFNFISTSLSSEDGFLRLFWFLLSLLFCY